MKQVIGIAGRESRYWIKLMEYINSRGQIEAFVCTSEDCLEEELQKRQPEALFREEDFAPQVSFSGKEIRIHGDRNCSEGIYQYQSAEQIYSAMVGLMSRETFVREEHQEATGQIYAVYSPLGRSGKTSFALAYARSHSFFYLGMEEYGLSGDNIHNMGEVLYHVRNRTENLLERMASWGAYWNGVKILGSPCLFQDIKLVSLEDYGWFFEQLKKEEFPSVILDIGTGCLMDFELFQFFDRIFVPVLPGKKNQTKLDLFWKLILEIYGELEDKFQVIQVPDMDWTSGEFLSLVKEQRKGSQLLS